MLQKQIKKRKVRNRHWAGSAVGRGARNGGDGTGSGDGADARTTPQEGATGVEFVYKVRAILGSLAVKFVLEE